MNNKNFKTIIKWVSSREVAVGRKVIAISLHVKVVLKKDKMIAEKLIICIDVYCGEAKEDSCIKTFIRNLSEEVTG